MAAASCFSSAVWLDNHKPSKTISPASTLKPGRVVWSQLQKHKAKSDNSAGAALFFPLLFFLYGFWLRSAVSCGISRISSDRRLFMNEAINIQRLSKARLKASAGQHSLHVSQNHSLKCRSCYLALFLFSLLLRSQLTFWKCLHNKMALRYWKWNLKIAPCACVSYKCANSLFITAANQVATLCSVIYFLITCFASFYVFISEYNCHWTARLRFWINPWRTRCIRVHEVFVLALTAFSYILPSLPLSTKPLVLFFSCLKQQFMTYYRHLQGSSVLLWYYSKTALCMDFFVFKKYLYACRQGLGRRCLFKINKWTIKQTNKEPFMSILCLSFHGLSFKTLKKQLVYHMRLHVDLL